MQQRVQAETNRGAKPVRDLFLAPYVGLYSALVRQSLPITTLQRSDFHRKLEGFRVLCLANEACLSADQVEAIRGFVSAGGGLIATYQTSLYDEKGNQRDDFALADVFGVHYERTLAATSRNLHVETDHPVTQGLPALESAVHDEPHVLVKLADGKLLATLTGGGSEAESVAAVVTHQYGSGRVVYIPGRFDAVQCENLSPMIEYLFGNAVRWVAHGQTPVEVTAPELIAATLFDQSDRRILHLVNLNGDTQYRNDTVEPIENIDIQLMIPEGSRVRQLRRLWDKADVFFQTRHGRIYFKLKIIGDYEVPSADLQTP